MPQAALLAGQSGSFWIGIALRSNRDYLPRPLRTPEPQIRRRTRTRDGSLSETTWFKTPNRTESMGRSGCSRALWRTSLLRKCHCFLFSHNVKQNNKPSLMPSHHKYVLFFLNHVWEWIWTPEIYGLHINWTSKSRVTTSFVKTATKRHINSENKSLQNTK